MKVLINTRHGGFNLSAEALMYLVEKKSPIIRKMHLSKYYRSSDGGWEKEFEKALKSGCWKLFKEGWYLFFDDLVNISNKYVYSLKDENSPQTRSHPDLVEVFKKLGKKVNSVCTELTIVEVPDNVKWYIEEYDGAEWVAEEHRTWYAK